MMMFCLADNPPDYVQNKVLRLFLWIVVSMSVQFSKALWGYSDLTSVCATRWPVWDLGNSVSCSLGLKVHDVLFEVRSMYPQLGGKLELMHHCTG